jgi:hypothetical protein
VPQENEDDDGDHGKFFDEGVLEVVDGGQDEFGAVVGGDQFHAGGQAGLDLFQPGFHAIDYGQGILTLANDHDAGDHFAVAIEIGHAAAHVRTERDGSHVAHADGDAGGADGERDVFEIGGGFCVTAAAHHVLAAGEFDQAAADIVVAAAHGGDHFRNRHAVSGQAVGVYLDLILANETAERGDFGDSGDRLEMIAEIPILDGAELGQVRAGLEARATDQSILEDPADAGGIGAEFGVHALRQAGENF